MLKRLLIITVSLFSLAGLSYAQRVDVNYGGKQEVETSFQGHKCTRTKREIYVKNYGPEDYGFRYNYYDLAPSGKEEGITKPLPKNFPYIGDATAGVTGLGLTDGAWYKNGFLGIRMNGKALNRTVAREINVEEGERGVVDFIWEPEWAEIKARFVFLPGDDKVYTEINLNPKEEVTSLSISLLCSPGHWGNWSKLPIDRWISTAVKSIQHDTKGVLDPKKEPWIFYFDTQANSINGACAVIYLPEEVKRVSVNQSQSLGTIVRTDIRFPPALRKLHFILYNFPDSYKKPEEAYNYLKENGEELLENLRKLKFEPKEDH